MNELVEYEERIFSALARITNAAGSIPSAAGGTEDLGSALVMRDEKIAALEAALDEARQSNEKVQEAADQKASELSNIEAQSREMRDRNDGVNDRIEELERLAGRLKDANAQLRESNAQLREKNQSLLGDSDAVNQSISAELNALRTTRSAEITEMDQILEELKPLVEGLNNA